MKFLLSIIECYCVVIVHLCIDIKIYRYKDIKDIYVYRYIDMSVIIVFIVFIIYLMVYDIFMNLLLIVFMSEFIKPFCFILPLWRNFY